MLGGVALLDLRWRRLLDLFLDQRRARNPHWTNRDPRWWNRLYRNRGNGSLRRCHREGRRRGQATAWASPPPTSITTATPIFSSPGVGRNILYRNRGDGTFEDVTAKAGIHAEPWSVGAGWFDYDGDGRLDLFVVNYVAWDPKTEPSAATPAPATVLHCHPDLYTGLPNTLYHNNGDGTFTDVSEAAGIRRHIGKGMGVAFADYDGDGRIDILVANDTRAQFPVPQRRQWPTSRKSDSPPESRSTTTGARSPPWASTSATSITTDVRTCF